MNEIDLVNCIAIMTKSLGHELDTSNICVNAVTPRPCSEDCWFSTGAAFDLSGGRATY